MATNNGINLNQAGIAVYDGAGNFNGRTLTAGSGINITNPDGIAGNPTISSTTTTLIWTEVTGTTQAMNVSNGYISSNAALVTFTLPATAAIGDQVQVLGKGAGGWKINQASNQQINLGILATSVGTSGSLASTKQFDTVELRCITAGASTIWTAKTTGNITVA